MLTDLLSRVATLLNAFVMMSTGSHAEKIITGYPLISGYPFLSVLPPLQKPVEEKSTSEYN